MLHTFKSQIWFHNHAVYMIDTLGSVVTWSCVETLQQQTEL